MSGKAIDRNAAGYLILILPIAVLIVLLSVIWPLLLALAVVGVGWKVWQSYRWQKWSQQVNPIFHQLIKENQGSITALDLAIKANFSAETAKRYLDRKAEEFGTQRQDDEDRGAVYYFITANTLGSVFDDSEPPRQPQRQDEGGGMMKDKVEVLEAESQAQLLQERSVRQSETTKEQTKIPLNKQLLFGSLIQSELARRFDVHSSTVYKHRDDPDFSEWSRSKDPDGIAWFYSPDTREFFPLEEE